MDPSAGPAREPYYNANYWGPQYQRYSKPIVPVAVPAIEDNWATSPDVHHTSFERSPPTVVDTPNSTPPISRAQYIPRFTTINPTIENDADEDADESDSSTSSSRHCEISECDDDACEDGCEDDCVDTCIEGPCTGNCSINNTADDCEDCLKCRAVVCNDVVCKSSVCDDDCEDDMCKCEDEECIDGDCDAAGPCISKCPVVKAADCMVARRTAVCYSPDCESTQPPQQRAFEAFPSPSYAMWHGAFPSTHDFGNFRFGMSPTEDACHQAADGRLQKRRRTEPGSPSDPPTPLSTSSTLSPAFEHPAYRPRHAEFPPPQNYLCLWGSGCGVPFGDYYGLNNHVLQAHLHAQNGYVCRWDACGEAENNLGRLLDHVKASHTSSSGHGNGHVCLWQGCNASFANSEDLEHHLANQHMPSKTTNILCQWEACGIQTSGLDGLATHLHNNHLAPAVPHHDHSEHSERERSASVSTWANTESSGVSVVPEGENALTCKWCENEGDEPCNQTFTSTYDLQTHTKEDHIAYLRKKTGYYCKWAGCHRREKEFSQKGKVERHMQTHTGFKSCRCEYCDKEFSAPQALQQHVRTHTGEKPYKCDICGKFFAQGSAMTMHRRVHTGERPLACDFPGCRKTFSESSNLSKHRKTHNAVGAHVCGYPGCPKSFHRLGKHIFLQPPIITCLPCLRTHENILQQWMCVNRRIYKANDSAREKERMLRNQVSSRRFSFFPCAEKSGRGHS
ncbi:hypothetical protein DFH27DRAFT_241531 [Peziza echinospora]|nr:hypothetical protein DFH27DRAFT_241531 [Peziza echinospora]